MRPDPLDERLARALGQRERDHLFRRRHTVRPIDAVHLEIDGAPYVNFSSNNYLGLTHHPRIVEAVAAAARDVGAGAAASPLITGYTAAHASAEAALAKWKGTEAAVLLPSGYQANRAAIETIRIAAELGGDVGISGGAGDARKSAARFLVDKLAHASLIDALGGEGSSRFLRHNDLDKLERLLRQRDPSRDDIDIVVTESIFSMDGDAAPLRELAALKEKYPFFLLLDEAHGSGVYGEGGAGYASELGLGGIVDAFVVTLSKALGCAGGAICGTKRFCDGVINFGRAYIYSTAVPPMLAAACEAAIGVMRDEPQRRRRVRELAARVREGVGLPGGDSPIVPIVLGDAQATIRAAEALNRQGLLVMPVRPPTVPRGTSRLRVTLSCEHSDREVDRLIASLNTLPPR